MAYFIFQLKYNLRNYKLLPQIHKRPNKIGNVKLNHLVTLAQLLPSRLIKILKVIPGDVLFYAKLWFKLKKNRDFRENFFYDLLLKKQFEEKSGHSSEEVEETFKPVTQDCSN
jgi:hypothetical protein